VLHAFKDALIFSRCHELADSQVAQRKYRRIERFGYDVPYNIPIRDDPDRNYPAASFFSNHHKIAYVMPRHQLSSLSNGCLPARDHDIADTNLTDRHSNPPRIFNQSNRDEAREAPLATRNLWARKE
jgi:hypothetical protein